MKTLITNCAFAMCLASTVYCTEIELLWTARAGANVSWDDNKIYFFSGVENVFSYLKSDSVKPNYETPLIGLFTSSRPVLGNDYLVYQNYETINSERAFFGVRGKHNWRYGGNYMFSNPYHISNDQFLVNIERREFRKYDAATKKILTNINSFMHDGVTMRPGDSRIIGDGKSSVCISFENRNISGHDERNESVVLVCLDSRSMEERWRTDRLFRPQNCLATDTHIIGNSRAFARDLVAINFLTGETDWVFQADKEIVEFKHIDYLQRIVIQDHTAVYFISQSGKLLDKYNKPERPLNQTLFYLHGSDSIGKYYGFIHGSSTQPVILKKTEDSWGLSLMIRFDYFPI